MAAAAPTWEDFTAAHPQFNVAEYAETGPFQLALSTRLLEPSTWDSFYSDGVMLDCAHNLVIAGILSAGGNAMELAAGPVSSVSAAGTSVSFGTHGAEGKSASADWYNKTSYGQLFLRLRNVVCPMGVMT